MRIGLRLKAVYRKASIKQQRLKLTLRCYPRHCLMVVDYYLKQPVELLGVAQTEVGRHPYCSVLERLEDSWTSQIAGS
jgi:hypothetical protein